MDMRLEAVPVPVSDLDQAKQFYANGVGFAVDHDVTPGDGVRVIQLTPPGSSCSIILSEGLAAMSDQPGSVRGLHLVVDDIDATHNALTGRGVQVGGIADLGGGVRMAGFTDHDGNTWALQEITVERSAIDDDSTGESAGD